MKLLYDLKCVACRSDSPALSTTQISELLPQVPDWQIVEIDDILRLDRTFKFKNFTEALAFTNQVGALAEAENHHPLIVLEWGKVTVQWWTHIIKGLHQNDFILAAKVDLLER